MLFQYIYFIYFFGVRKFDRHKKRFVIPKKKINILKQQQQQKQSIEKKNIMDNDDKKNPKVMMDLKGGKICGKRKRAEVDPKDVEQANLSKATTAELVQVIEAMREVDTSNPNEVHKTGFHKYVKDIDCYKTGLTEKNYCYTSCDWCCEEDVYKENLVDDPDPDRKGCKICNNCLEKAARVVKAFSL